MESKSKLINDKQYDEKKAFSEQDLKKFSSFYEYPAYIDLQQRFELYGRPLIEQTYYVLTEGVSRDTIKINGKELINFSGYNYVGMSGDPYVSNAAIKAIEEYGTSVSASRSVSGEKPLHRQLELKIAQFIGHKEDSIVFTAGHATNMGTISHLFGENDLIIHDSLIHNSSWMGTILSGSTHINFPHNNMDALDEILQKHRKYYERVLILTEGLFSMDGDIPNLPKLIEIKKKHYAFLMVDEAHSLGVIGKTGRGICEYFNVNPEDIDICMGTLSKSFGSCGGFIAGNHKFIEFMKYTCPSFIFSAGMPAPNAAAALASIELLEKEPQRITDLHNRSKLLLDLLKKAGANTGDSKDSPIIPVIVGDDELAIKLSFALRKQGIYVLPLFYPAVRKGQARIRFFVNSTHTEEQIHYTATVVQEIFKQFKK
ncbi:MAG: 8-amino-7-oxononanoate synthase [Chlamydia sp. 32-24]|nr:MAG: 8-amino-7-oxononanoate synthase [Chlamydia sp. 32-24]